MEPAEVDNNEEEDGEITVHLVHRSLNRFQNTMYVNLYEDHFSYIHDFKRYSHSYQCHRCGKFWKTGFQLNRHEQTCEGSVKHKLPGGVSRPAASIFTQLEDYGIAIPDRLKYYPNWATYDIEAMLVPQEDLHDTEKLQWTTKHVPGLSYQSW